MTVITCRLAGEFNIGYSTVHLIVKQIGDALSAEAAETHHELRDTPSAGSSSLFEDSASEEVGEQSATTSNLPVESIADIEPEDDDEEASSLAEDEDDQMADGDEHETIDLNVAAAEALQNAQTGRCRWSGVWSDNERELLIEAIRARPLLYDISDPQYRNKEERVAAFEAVGASISDQMRYTQPFTGEA